MTPYQLKKLRQDVHAALQQKWPDTDFQVSVSHGTAANKGRRGPQVLITRFRVSWNGGPTAAHVKTCTDPILTADHVEALPNFFDKRHNLLRRDTNRERAHQHLTSTYPFETITDQHADALCTLANKNPDDAGYGRHLTGPENDQFAKISLYHSSVDSIVKAAAILHRRLNTAA